jgi:hypothetical protein
MGPRNQVLDLRSPKPALMAHAYKSDAEYIATTPNMARFFTEHRQVALILLLATFVWGWFAYQNMPKRKDPNIPVRVASAQCPWPGATTEQLGAEICNLASLGGSMRP